ncbi:MAG: hypothetical protein NTZ79_11055 [Proteobacteria bacterium]|nr:hypothetical protein [Pseudomonadota bacterium]
MLAAALVGELRGLTVHRLGAAENVFLVAPRAAAAQQQGDGEQSQ